MGWFSGTLGVGLSASVYNVLLSPARLLQSAEKNAKMKAEYEKIGNPEKRKKQAAFRAAWAAGEYRSHKELLGPKASGSVRRVGCERGR